MIGKIQFRFLDPVLSRKYDSDGMSTALFTTVGSVDATVDANATVHTDAITTESLCQWPLTVIVPRDVIERLRKVLLTIMNFECTDGFERKEILPQIVATASFFCEASISNFNVNVNDNTDGHDPEDEDQDQDQDPTHDKRDWNNTNMLINSNTIATGWFGTVDNTIELRTPEDVQTALRGLLPGGDLKIWIETSPPGILRRASQIKSTRSESRTRSAPPSPIDTGTKTGSTEAEKETENHGPNRIGSKIPSVSPSSPTSSVSSSLKAIAKVGRGGRRSRISAGTKLTKEVPFCSSRAQKDEGDSRGATSAVVDADIDMDTNGAGVAMVLDSDSAIPTPGFPAFSDFGFDLVTTRFIGTSDNGRISPATDDTIATSSISSDSATPDYQNPNRDDNDNDGENHLLLALAGCAPRGGYGSFDDLYSYDHEDDGLLSGLLICDEEYTSDEDSFALFPNVQGHDSACSMLTYSSSHSTTPCDTENDPCDMDTCDVHNKDSSTSQDKVSARSAAKTHTHLLPSFFETKRSLSSVSISSNAPSSGASRPRFVSDASSTMGYGTSSLGSRSQHSAVSSAASSLSLSMTGSRAAVGALAVPRPKKDAVFLESSSLLQGSELEMATILESVLGSILVPDDCDGDESNNIALDGDDIFGADADDFHTKNSKSCNNFHHHESSSPQFPCPTPQELLAMDWNHH